MEESELCFDSGSSSDSVGNRSGKQVLEISSKEEAANEMEPERKTDDDYVKTD